MRFIRRLLAVELVAQIALAICALSFALVFVVGGALVTGQNAQDLGVATSALLALAFAVYCTGAVSVRRFLIGAAGAGESVRPRRLSAAVGVA